MKFLKNMKKNQKKIKNPENAHAKKDRKQI